MSKTSLASDLDLGLPQITRPAWFADAVVNYLGLAAALAAAFALPIMARSTGHAELVPAVAIYGTALVASFLASALYNTGPFGGQNGLLRKCDHAAIYLKIAGTVTVFAALNGSGFAWAMLALTWIGAIVGILRKTVLWRAPGRLDPLLYLALAWFSALPLVQHAGQMPVASLVLIGVAGGLYTLGVPIYLSRRLTYARALWHLCVLAAASAFFAAFALALHA